MGFFDDSYSSYQDNYDQVHNQGSFTHDALGGAVAYEATKAYENHLRDNGQPTSHAKAKEIFAGLAGAAATNLVETKGLDAYDSYEQRKRLQATGKFSDQHFDNNFSCDNGYGYNYVSQQDQYSSDRYSSDQYNQY